jgi:hypothetical protein
MAEAEVEADDPVYVRDLQPGIGRRLDAGLGRQAAHGAARFLREIGIADPGNGIFVT